MIVVMPKGWTVAADGRSNPTPPVEWERYAEAVARAAADAVGCGVSWLSIFGASRRRPIARARHLTWAVLWNRGERCSLPFLASIWGCDHTTILTAVHCLSAADLAEFESLISDIRPVVWRSPNEFSGPCRSDPTHRTFKTSRGIICEQCGTRVIKGTPPPSKALKNKIRK